MKKPKKAKSVNVKLAPKLDIQIVYKGPGAGGHDFTATVKAVANERIRRVEIFLDGYTVGKDSLSPPNSCYKREFFEEGHYQPGKTHKVSVTAVGTSVTETASLVWTDRLKKPKPKKAKK